MAVVINVRVFALPSGINLLVDEDGAFLIDADGSYIIG